MKQATIKNQQFQVAVECLTILDKFQLDDEPFEESVRGLFEASKEFKYSRLYTLSGATKGSRIFNSINCFLKNPQTQAVQPKWIAEASENIDFELNLMEKYTADVYRGTMLSDIPVQGDILYNQGFLSTTKDQRTGFIFARTGYLVVFKGGKGSILWPFSSYPAEWEVLFARMQCFQVLSVEDNAYYQYYTLTTEQEKDLTEELALKAKDKGYSVGDSGYSKLETSMRRLANKGKIPSAMSNWYDAEVLKGNKPSKPSDYIEESERTSKLLLDPKFRLEAEGQFFQKLITCQQVQCADHSDKKSEWLLL